MKPVHRVGGFYGTESESTLSSRAVVTEVKTALANNARADGRIN